MIESIRRLLPVILLVLIALTPLTACASMTGTSGSQRLSDSQTKQVCSIWLPIGWEDADSDDTIVEVKVNNAKRDTYCAGVK